MQKSILENKLYQFYKSFLESDDVVPECVINTFYKDVKIVENEKKTKSNERNR